MTNAGNFCQQSSFRGSPVACAGGWMPAQGEHFNDIAPDPTAFETCRMCLANLGGIDFDGPM